jgi:hypothetical protein
MQAPTFTQALVIFRCTRFSIWVSSFKKTRIPNFVTLPANFQQPRLKTLLSLHIRDISYTLHQTSSSLPPLTVSEYTNTPIFTHSYQTTYDSVQKRT